VICLDEGLDRYLFIEELVQDPDLQLSEIEYHHHLVLDQDLQYFILHPRDLATITEKMKIMDLKEVIGVAEALGIKELNLTNNHTGFVGNLMGIMILA
jgi:hypothetical protein